MDEPTVNKQVPKPDDTPNATADSEPQSGSQALPSVHPVRKKKPIGALIAAGVLVLLLAATAVYGYSKPSNKKAATTSQTSQAAVKTTPATTKDVDQTSKDIDAALQKANNTKDVGPADLTDTSLGL